MDQDVLENVKCKGRMRYSENTLLMSLVDVNVVVQMLSSACARPQMENELSLKPESPVISDLFTRLNSGMLEHACTSAY
jgi:hypothetical protein